MNTNFFPQTFRAIPGLVAHDCGYPLSRYTCRATRVAADFLDFIAFWRCSIGVALHPLKILVSHLPPPPLCREVSHRNLGLKRCRATRGCRSYSCGCRATLCNQDSGISPQNPGISHQKSLIFLVSRDIPNFLAPTRGRPPTPPENIRTQKFGFVLFFRA